MQTTTTMLVLKVSVHEQSLPTVRTLTSKSKQNLI